MAEIIHLEILRKHRSKIPNKSKLKEKEIIELVQQELKQKGKILPGSKVTIFSSSVLEEQVEYVYISELGSTEEGSSLDISDDGEIAYEKFLFNSHVYELDTSGPQVGTIGSLNDDDGEQSACNHWILPSSDFDNLWENLIYDCSVKENLLNYAETTMFFSEHAVNDNIITWNRLVLLHGPPGTGKTSLCKAIAHKLTIRLRYKFKHGGELIEINSHSLFSKYFSESGKLVMQMFDKIKDQLADENALIFVLIDEVESLTLSRQNALNKKDPSDAVRVVNAILTQIDQLKRYPNVLILTTSNITGAMDKAFMDRADIKQYIGLPSKFGIYAIYKTCIEELVRVGIILCPEDCTLMPVSSFSRKMCNDCHSKQSVRLFEISSLSVGLSGRSLRKIPFLAYAHYIRTRVVPLDEFLDGLQFAVNRFKNEQMSVNEDNQHIET